MKTPYLSVVIPAFNEARRLPPTLKRIMEYLDQRGELYEILVIDDGSVDGTAAVAQGVGGSAVIKVIRNEVNHGKGYSVRQGLLMAEGERRLMTDADLSTPIEELPRLLARMDEGYDIIIASRALPGATIEIHQPWYRENMGRIFNLMVQVLAVPGLHDTQCGFKLFSARAACEAFTRAQLDGFSFDVEALFIARKRGLRIAEIPVIWRNDAASRVAVFRDSTRMFLDLIQIRMNDWQGQYEEESSMS